RYRKEDDGFDEEELSEAGASPWERSGLRGLFAKRRGVQDGQGAPVQGQSIPPALSPSVSRQVAEQLPPEDPPAPEPPPHQQSEEQQRDRQDPLFTTNVQEAAPSTSKIVQRRSSDDVRLPPFVAGSPVQPSELGFPNAVPVQRLRRGLELVSAGPRGLMLQHLLDGRDLFEREEETSDETRPSKNVQTDISLAPAVIPFAAMETSSWSFMCTQGTDSGDSAKKPTENPNPSKDVDLVRAQSPATDAQEMAAAAKKPDEYERPLGDSGEVPPLRSPPPVHANSPYCLKKTSSDELTRLLVLEHSAVRRVEELSCEPYDNRIGAKGPEMSSRPEDETSFQSFDADADTRARAVLLQACRSPRSEVQ
ncbi:unnamed protein product, partial [Ixodes persulcatus]